MDGRLSRSYQLPLPVLVGRLAAAARAPIRPFPCGPRHDFQQLWIESPQLASFLAINPVELFKMRGKSLPTLSMTCMFSVWKFW